MSDREDEGADLKSCEDDAADFTGETSSVAGFSVALLEPPVPFPVVDDDRTSRALLTAGEECVTETG